MTCKIHDDGEQDLALADGLCPLCLRAELTALLSPAPAATVTGEKECECCEYRHGISSHFFHVCCGLCKHPIVNPKGEKLYVGFESVDAWQEGRRLTPPALTDAMRAVDESDATLEKYQSDLDKLHKALGQSNLEVAGGFVEHVCAHLLHVRKEVLRLADLNVITIGRAGEILALTVRQAREEMRKYQEEQRSAVAAVRGAGGEGV